MCGIAAAVGFISPSITKAVEAMSYSQIHRGPNSNGIWLCRNTDSTGVVFAHRRLAIIDLSEDGHQPMADPLTGNVIIYNGEVYNFRELRKELEEMGITFSSLSDTEVVLKAYSVWGQNFVQRLRGMFAFVIWDSRENKVFCVRDRLGIKPLYYTSIVGNDGKPTILLSSELRAILASGCVKKQLCVDGLNSFIWNGFIAGPKTIIKNVNLLPAGTFVNITTQGQIDLPKPYWTIPSFGKAEDTQALLSELENAVKMRLISDVPLGIFLSGGIDSSAIAALAVKSGIGKMKTFTLCFPEKVFNEAIYAHRIAESLGTEHVEVYLTQQMFLAQLDKALQSLDQPTFDGINTFFISQAVREAGVTVALAGIGGDELFGGYRTFKDIPPAHKLARLFSYCPSIIQRTIAESIAQLQMLGSGHLSVVSPQTRWGKLSDLLNTKGDLLSIYQVFYSLFTLDFQSQLLHPDVKADLDYGLHPLVASSLRHTSAYEPLLTAISRFELSLFTGERLLRDTDSTSMSVSLEVRLPLLDHIVVNHVTQQYIRQRFLPLGKKKLLRKLALQNLDVKLFDRPKSGFVMPFEQWSREKLSTKISDLFSQSSLCTSVGISFPCLQQLWHSFQVGAPGVYWSRIWSIYTLLWWCQYYRVTL